MNNSELLNYQASDGLIKFGVRLRGLLAEQYLAFAETMTVIVCACLTGSGNDV